MTNTEWEKIANEIVKNPKVKISCPFHKRGFFPALEGANCEDCFWLNQLWKVKVNTGHYSSGDIIRETNSDFQELFDKGFIEKVK